MRVVLAIDGLAVGGAEFHVVDLAIALRSRGHDVTVATARGGPLADSLSGAGIRVSVLLGQSVKRRVSMAYAIRLGALLGANRADLIHAHLYASTVASALAARKTKIPLLVTEHSEGGWQGPFSRIVAAISLARAARVIAVSDGIRERLIDDLKVNRRKIECVPNAVPRASGVFRLTPKTSSGSSNLTVGVVARLCREKGVDLFLRAAAEVVQSHSHVHFVVIGDGPDRFMLEEEARRSGLKDRVRFLGIRKRGGRPVADLDMLVVPSRTEGSPLVVLEARQAGVPVIATCVGGIPQQIEDGRDGLLVPTEDPAALGHAIRRLLDDCTLRERLARAARRRAADWDHERMVDRVEMLYASVALIGYTSAGGRRKLNEEVTTWRTKVSARPWSLPPRQRQSLRSLPIQQSMPRSMAPAGCKKPSTASR